MKKIYVLLITSLVSLCFVSCGGGGHEEELAEQYIDACTQNDFATAHAVLDKMMIDSDHGEKYDMYDHVQYVNREEILYLIAQGDRQSSDRLFFLLRETSLLGMHPSEMINLAILQENSYLANKLLDYFIDFNSSYVVGSKNAFETNLEAALNAGMDDVAEKLVKVRLEKDPNSIFYSSVIHYYKDKGIYEETVRDYITQSILKLKSKVITARPAIGHVEFGDHEEINACRAYSKAMAKNNAECRKLLELAISINDRSLSKKIVSLFKPTLTMQEDGWWNKYIVTLDNSDIEEAERELKTMGNK